MELGVGAPEKACGPTPSLFYKYTCSLNTNVDGAAIFMRHILRLIPAPSPSNTSTNVDGATICVRHILCVIPALSHQKFDPLFRFIEGPKKIGRRRPLPQDLSPRLCVLKARFVPVLESSKSPNPVFP
jgi:hypothetical protein